MGSLGWEWREKETGYEVFVLVHGPIVYLLGPVVNFAVGMTKRKKSPRIEA